MYCGFVFKILKTLKDLIKGIVICNYGVQTFQLSKHYYPINKLLRIKEVRPSKTRHS